MRYVNSSGRQAAGVLCSGWLASGLSRKVYESRGNGLLVTAAFLEIYPADRLQSPASIGILPNEVDDDLAHKWFFWRMPITIVLDHPLTGP